MVVVVLCVFVCLCAVVCVGVIDARHEETYKASYMAPPCLSICYHMNPLLGYANAHANWESTQSVCLCAP